MLLKSITIKQYKILLFKQKSMHYFKKLLLGNASYPSLLEQFYTPYKYVHGRNHHSLVLPLARTVLYRLAPILRTIRN